MAFIVNELDFPLAFIIAIHKIVFYVCLKFIAQNCVVLRIFSNTFISKMGLYYKIKSR